MGRSCEVNDVHSQLNRTTVNRIVQVESVDGLQQAVRRAAAAGLGISIAGGRHAMGGQQFGRGTVLLDMPRLDRVLEFDAERGLITVEAGIAWPALVTHLLWASPEPRRGACPEPGRGACPELGREACPEPGRGAGAGQVRPWGIVQKQTGADRLTIGGALSANIHGRGLRLRPMIGDIESFELVDATGALIPCSRTRNAQLFSLAIGGYGLFGVIARVTLRLTPRHKIQRHVTIARIAELPSLFDRRIRDGFGFGDCQFATDPQSADFMRTGVFSCYRPVEDATEIAVDQKSLSAADWQRLLLLAHVNKSRAFDEYASYYMSTDGQVYWSDTHQLASYLDGYHQAIDRQLDAPLKGSEMISELYVRRDDLPAFMEAVRADARRHDVNIIYGTIRLIEKDDESVLAWARESWACFVFNLHVDHSPDGLKKAAGDFRRLIDRACDFGGSYYLTYHRWATRDQVTRCHPRMREFLELKHAWDPARRFTSDWYEHHLRLMNQAPTGECE